MPVVPGSILVHEHVLVDFVGADQVSRSRYDAADVFRIARPKLEELKPFGCKRLLECTPNYLGRDPGLLARLQDATGIEIWTNTGIYGAADRKFVPAFVEQESPAGIARRWIDEWRNGIDGVKPRFIKTGVNRAPLHPVDRKLIEAAAITCLETGLPIASHTSGGGPAAEEQFEILLKAKCPLSKFIWVHAQNEKDPKYHERAARAGAWIEFDGINAKSADWHLQCLNIMLMRGVVQRTLISQDSGWYRVGEPGGGQYNGYTWLYESFLAQVAADFHHLLLVTNPSRAFGD